MAGRRLGRGLSFLLSDRAAAEAATPETEAEAKKRAASESAKELRDSGPGARDSTKDVSAKTRESGETASAETASAETASAETASAGTGASGKDARGKPKQSEAPRGATKPDARATQARQSTDDKLAGSEAATSASSQAPEQRRSGPELVELELLVPNPFQPRKHFDPEELERLAASIRSSGILQPLLLRPKGKGYEIVAGERRARAAKLAGLSQVPAVVRDVDDHDMRLLALVENLQRADLDPIEKALSFQELKTSTRWTHERLAKAVGLERSSVSNYLRLLELDVSIQNDVRRGKLSMGHARAILAAAPEHRATLAAQVLADGLSVRDTELLARDVAERAEAANPASAKPKSVRQAPWAREMEENLLSALGCRVQVKQRSGKGRIVLELGGRDEFNRVYELLMNALPTLDEDDLVARKVKSKRKKS